MRRLAFLVVGPEVVGGSQRCEVDIGPATTLEHLARDLERQLELFEPGAMITVIEAFDYDSGTYRAINDASTLEDRARLRVRCARAGGGEKGSERVHYAAHGANGLAHDKRSRAERDLDARAEEVLRQAQSPEAQRRFREHTPDRGGAAGRAALIGKALPVSSSSAVSVASSSGASAAVDQAQRIGSAMCYLNGPLRSGGGSAPLLDEQLYASQRRPTTSRPSSAASSARTAHGGGASSRPPSAHGFARAAAPVGAGTASVSYVSASSPPPPPPPPPPLPPAAQPREQQTSGAALQAALPYHSPSRPANLFADSGAAETLTAFFVYNGVDGQRAKAITIDRRRPDLAGVLATLEAKFQMPLCLGYIDPDSGDCEEVRAPRRFAQIINDKTHRHDPNAGVTFQCWMSAEAQQQQQQQDQQARRQQAAHETSAAVARPASASSSTRHSARSYGAGGPVTVTLAPRDVVSTPVSAHAQVGSPTSGRNGADAAAASTTRVSQHALQRLQAIEVEQARRERDVDAARRDNLATPPPQQQQQQPSAPRASGRRSTAVASVISVQSAAVLVTEDDLHDAFDELDVEGSGLVTKGALRAYFDRTVDTMGVPGAAQKFEKMLASARRRHELDFQEFAIVMLKIAQW